MSQQEKSDSSPDGFPMVMGSRGRAFVMGCPLITEPMRKSGLEWIKRWKKGLVLGTPTQCVANLVVQGAISEGAMQLFTRSEEGLWKRSWTQNEVTHIEDLLKGLGKLPLGIIQGNEEETIEAVGDVEVRLVPLCSSWSIKPLVNLKKNVGPENFSIIPSDWTPAIQWPFPDDVTQKSADGVNLDRVNLLLLHAVLDEVSRYPDSLKTSAQFNCELQGEPIVIGMTRWDVVVGDFSEEETKKILDCRRYSDEHRSRRLLCMRTFSSQSWKAMLSLQKGLMNGSITEQPPLSSVDPLSASLAGLSVVAIVNDRCVGSGFMSSRGTLSQSLSDAKLYPDLLTAQRSIKGFGSGSLGIDSESAVYFGTEVKLLGLAPGFAISKSRPNTMASGILNRLDNAALTAIVEQGDEGSKSCDQPSGSKKQGPGRSRRM